MDPMIGMVFMIPWTWAPLNYQLCQGQSLTLNQYEALYSLMGTVFGGNGSTNFNLPNLQGRTPIGTGVLNASQYTLGATGGAQAVTLSQTNLPIHNHPATFTGTGGGGSTPSTATGAVTLPFSTTANLTTSATATLPTSVSGTVKLAVNAAGGTATPSEGAALARPGLGTATVYTSAATAGALGIGGPQTLTGSATGPVAGAATGTVSGNASGNVTLNVTGGGGGITGGSVTVGNAGASAPFSNMQPYLTMAFVIAVNGLYPDRP